MSAIKDATILIIEDDLSQTELYRHLLCQMNYENVHYAKNYNEAIDLFDKVNPNIALIDINLEEAKNGIDVAITFNEKKIIPIAFITSCYFDEFYESAKVANPIAFLDKRISELKLKQVIELGLNTSDDGPKKNINSKLPAYFFVRANTGLKKIITAEIEWIEVDGKYCFIQSNGKKYPIRISLKELQEKLPEEKFVRVHQSFSVNLDKVTSFNSNDNNIFVEDKKIPIGRMYKKDLTELLYLI